MEPDRLCWRCAQSYYEEQHSSSEKKDSESMEQGGGKGKGKGAAGGMVSPSSRGNLSSCKECRLLNTCSELFFTSLLDSSIPGGSDEAQKGGRAAGGGEGGRGSGFQLHTSRHRNGSYSLFPLAPRPLDTPDDNDEKEGNCSEEQADEGEECPRGGKVSNTNVDIADESTGSPIPEPSSSTCAWPPPVGRPFGVAGDWNPPCRNPPASSGNGTAGGAAGAGGCFTCGLAQWIKGQDVFEERGSILDQFFHRSGHTATLVPSLHCIVLIGGNDERCIYTDVHIYDLFSSRLFKVSTKGGLPLPVFGHTAVLLADGHTIAMYGGQSRTAVDLAPNLIFTLDVPKLTWLRGSLLTLRRESNRPGGWTLGPQWGQSCLPLLPRRHQHIFMDAIKGRNYLLCFGGRSADQEHNETFVIDVQTASYFCLAVRGEKPPPRRRHIAVLYKRHFMIIHGGRCGQIMRDDLWVLDVPAAKWYCICPYTPAATLRALYAKYDNDDDEEDQVLSPEDAPFWQFVNGIMGRDASSPSSNSSSPASGMSSPASPPGGFAGASAYFPDANSPAALLHQWQQHTSAREQQHDEQQQNENQREEEAATDSSADQPPQAAPLVSVEATLTAAATVVDESTTGTGEYNAKWYPFEPRTGSAAVLQGEYLYVFGGFCQPGASSSEIVCYSILENTWSLVLRGSPEPNPPAANNGDSMNPILPAPTPSRSAGLQPVAVDVHFDARTMLSATAVPLRTLQLHQSNEEGAPPGSHRETPTLPQEAAEPTALLLIGGRCNGGCVDGALQLHLQRNPPSLFSLSFRWFEDNGFVNKKFIEGLSEGVKQRLLSESVG